MAKFIFIALAFISGAFLPVQAALNTRLGRSVGNPVYASLFSFIVGAIGIALYIILTRQTFSWEGVRTAPVYAWIGGLLGAFYVTAIIYLFPKLGPGLTFGLVIAGQMILAALLEHFNILVAQPHPLNLPRVLGILFVIAGVILLRLF
ncbi:MAG: DMT family transporter [Flavisolibacter sp.]